MTEDGSKAFAKFGPELDPKTYGSGNHRYSHGGQGTIVMRSRNQNLVDELCKKCVGGGIRTYDQLPAVGLKSTPVTTRAN